MKIKTAELTGPALDWAVAKCEGAQEKPETSSAEYASRFADQGKLQDFNGEDFGVAMSYGALYRMVEAIRSEPPKFKPSTDWSQAGPIVEREKIGVGFYDDGCHARGGEWCALMDVNRDPVEAFGSTALLAAMRVYVASRLGDEVEIPEELQ